MAMSLIRLGDEFIALGRLPDESRPPDHPYAGLFISGGKLPDPPANEDEPEPGGQ